MITERKKRSCPIIILLIFLSLIGINACAEYSQGDSQKVYGPFSPMLSPDGKKIIFYIQKGEKTDLATYDINTRKTFRFKLKGNDYYLDPVFSSDAKKITFVSGKKLTGGNIFIVNSDGSNMHQLTNIYSKYPEGGGTYLSSGLPSFRADGRKIIFVRSAIVRQRSMGGTMKSHWDVYEVDVATGVENRLTNYKFFTIKRPYYLPNGQEFIFSGDITSSKLEAGGSDFREYEKMYDDNKIFIMDGKNNKLCPAFIYGVSSSSPSVSGDGVIVFIARTNHLDAVIGPYTYDLFINTKGSIKRLTNMNFTGCIAAPFISFDGSRIVFEACKKDSVGPSVWIINSDGTGMTEINLDSFEWN